MYVLCTDIDEDIFKALAGDESLEEDRLAWLIFNENKKASKRRSSKNEILILFSVHLIMIIFIGEFEAPNLKCLKTDSSTSEVATSDVEEDSTTTNDKTPSKIHSSKSIYITEDDLSNENCFDNYNEEDYLSWVSHSKGNLNSYVYINMYWSVITTILYNFTIQRLKASMQQIIPFV